MTYLIKPDTSTARRYVTWLITCLLRVCSALYYEQTGQAQLLLRFVAMQYVL